MGRIRLFATGPHASRSRPWVRSGNGGRAACRGAFVNAAAALDAGNGDVAAERFIDYWMGNGSWLQTPESRKPAIVASNVKGACVVHRADSSLAIPFTRLGTLDTVGAWRSAASRERCRESNDWSLTGARCVRPLRDRRVVASRVQLSA